MKGQPKLTGFGYFGLLLMFIGAAIGVAIWMFYQINRAELSTALFWGGIFAIPGMVIVVLNDGRSCTPSPSAKSSCIQKPATSRGLWQYQGACSHLQLPGRTEDE